MATFCFYFTQFIIHMRRTVWIIVEFILVQFKKKNFFFHNFDCFEPINKIFLKVDCWVLIYGFVSAMSMWLLIGMLFGRYSLRLHSNNSIGCIFFYIILSWCSALFGVGQLWYVHFYVYIAARNIWFFGKNIFPSNIIGIFCPGQHVQWVVYT